MIKKRVNRFIFFIISGILLFNLPGCNPQSGPVSEDDGKSGIVFYDALFKIEPAEGVFRSQQRVTVTADQAKGNTVTIFLSNSLVIDNLSLEDYQGNEVPLKSWSIITQTTKEYFWGKISLSEIEIEAKNNLSVTGQLVIVINYHLPTQMIEEGRTDNIYNLFVSSVGSHAGGPESGAFPMVSGDLEAPFRITIQHPITWQCVLPGEVTDYRKSDRYTSTTYESEQAYDPSFSCAPYQVMKTEVDALNFEIYTPPNLKLSEQMLSDGAEILSLYTAEFGYPMARSLRIVFPDLEHSLGGGESNGNLVILGDIKPYLTYDDGARETFSGLISHEGYHLWNTWSVRWQGKLTEWWVEGGATFMSSWVNEKMNGRELGAKIRLRNLETFDKEQAFRHKNPLASLDESWFDDWALVYIYGSQVWEQLRMAVGDEALNAGLKEFYSRHYGKASDYDNLIICIGKYTQINVDGLLKQWTEQNVNIDLSIKDPTIREVNGRYEIKVDVQVEADNDYLIFTSLGYKTSPQAKWKLIDLRLQKAGVHTVVFESDSIPMMIQVDPEYRVPQINLSDNAWVK